MAKNFVKAKPGQLKAEFGTIEKGNHPEVQYAWGGQGASKSDARILSIAFEELPVFMGRSLMAELKERGYDLSTLKFSIKMK